MNVEKGSLKMYQLLLVVLGRYWYLLKAEAVVRDHSNSDSNGKHFPDTV